MKNLFVCCHMYLDSRLSSERQRSNQCWFGRHSYSLYLFHFAVLNLTMTLADRAGGLGKGLWVFGAAFVLVTILSALVATVTKPLLEDRGTAMGRALVSWLTTTPHTVRRNAG